MSVLVTWWGLLEQARVKAFVTVPGPLDNEQNGLMVLSQAQRELQDYSNAVKRVLTVTIDGTATDGGYGDPLDVRQPLNAQFTPSGSSKEYRMHPMAPEEMDALRRGAQYSPPPPVGPPFVNQWFYTIDQGKIFIYPYVNVAGVFTLRYLPYLHEFQPSNLVGDWATVTLTAMQTWMKANGPAREFAAQASGLSDCLAADLMEKYNTHHAYPERYAELKQNFEKAKMYAVRNTTIQSKGIQSPRSFGIIR